MTDDFKTDIELARLESMHQRVEKLRSRLRDLKLETYDALGLAKKARQKAPQNGQRQEIRDGVSLASKVKKLRLA